MTVYNDSLETSATATSSCPAIGTDVTNISAAGSSSLVVTGFTPAVTVSTAAAASVATPESYAILLNTAASSSIATPSVVVNNLATSTARGRSTLIAALDQLAVSTAASSSSIALMDIPMLLVSAAAASSTATVNTTANTLATESAAAVSSVITGLIESLVSSGAATSVVTLLRLVSESAVSAAASASSIVTASSVVSPDTLLSEGAATSTLTTQTDAHMLVDNTAEVTSDVWFKNPNQVAWLMNTETTAISWYDNFDFESIAQPPGKTFAIAADGLYELIGDTDSGEDIDANIVSGFTDFGAPQVKRVDVMYFGYTSDGIISATVETKDSGHAPSTHSLEERDATAPRTSRITPAKGLWGRYWRFTIRNVDGANFEVHDATADIAVSKRRV